MHGENTFMLRPQLADEPVVGDTTFHLHRVLKVAQSHRIQALFFHELELDVLRQLVFQRGNVAVSSFDAVSSVEIEPTHASFVIVLHTSAV